MKKLLFVFVTTAIISLAFTGIYFTSPADGKPYNECPYLKNKSEITCPYLEEKYSQTESEYPNLNEKPKSPSMEKQSPTPQCPYLKNKYDSKRIYKTIKIISS